MYIPKEEIEKAKQMDLLTYLMNYEPENLKKESANSYCTVEHDSLKISNGMWFWFSKGIGGKSALDYLIKVKGYTLPQAVEIINGRTIEKSPVFCYQPKEKILQIPALSDTTNRAFSYLISRGINSQIINYCIDKKLILETEQYHNVVFAGYDETNNIRYANLRGTKGNFKGEVKGSDKKYAFRICATDNPERLHIFESAIDLLSYISLQIMSDRDWTKDAYLSLGGVSVKAKELPVQLKYFFDGNKLLKTICMHLDNDEAGRTATLNLLNQLRDRYRVFVHTPLIGKDVNEELMILTGRLKEKEGEVR